MTEPNANAKQDPLFVIGIGSSAGGLEALRPLISGLRSSGRMSYIIAQHQSPQHRSMLSELLARETQLKVVEARHGAEITPDTIFVTPPNKDVGVSDGRIRLRQPQAEIGPKPSVDFLFDSLSRAYGEHAIGVLLSGTGSDGTYGLRAIKAAAGITIAQSPASAKYDSMPQSAIRAGAVDRVLDPPAIARELHTIVTNPARPQVPENAAGIERDSTFQDIIKRIYIQTRIDFSNYKRATLERQLSRRMTALQIPDFGRYASYVDEHPQELEALCHSFLISVTSFFRDTTHYEALKPLCKRLVQRRNDTQRLRIWVPGCATGEEAYSIALIIAEAIGPDISRYDIKIFGTDIDVDATLHARSGIYPEATLEGMDPNLLERYFSRQGRDYQIVKQIRDLCIFARQDLVQDPPFVRLDMISCRNVLIYMDSILQEKLLKMFHYALLEGGYLFLGKSEGLGNCSGLFTPIDSRHRLFKRKNIEQQVQFNFSTSRELFTYPYPVPNGRRAGHNTYHSEPFKECLLQAYAPDSVLVDQELRCLHFFGKAQRFLQISGSANLQLLQLIRAELRTELRTLLKRGADEMNEVRAHPVHMQIEDQPFKVCCVARPVPLDQDGEEGFLVSFELTPSHTGSAPDSPSGQPQSTANDAAAERRANELEHELQSTRQHLQAVIEELETSNEELQALNEELQASAEELQATNEELETSNEELQATNEELTTVNEELQIKSTELSAANNNLENLQNSINQALVVVDRQCRLIRYTPLAVKLFGILPTDIGRSIAQLPTHLAIQDLFGEVRKVMSNGQSHIEEVGSTDRSVYLMQINPYREDLQNITGAVITFADITRLFRTQRALVKAQQQLQEIMDRSLEGFLRLSMDGTVLEVNSAFASLLDYEPEEMRRFNHESLVPEAWHDLEARMMKESLQHGYTPLWEKEYRRRDGSFVPVELRSYVSRDERNNPVGMWCFVRDISKRKQAEKERQQRINRYQALINAVGEVVYEFDGQNDQLSWHSPGQKLFGHDISALGTTFATLLDLVHPQDRERIAHHYESMRTVHPGEGTRTFDLVYRVQTHEGPYHWARDRGVQVHGEVLRVTGVIEDVSHLTSSLPE